MIHEFMGRCPSKKQIDKVIKDALNHDAIQIIIHWGENTLTLEKQSFNRSRPWLGFGWIKRHSGHDIAEGLNNG